MKNRCRAHLPLIIILAVLILDQGSKFFVKLNMRIGEEIHIFSWFRIHFLENNGMAFGMSFGEFWGKLALSLLRLLAIGFLAWYIGKANKKFLSGEAVSRSGLKYTPALIVSLSLILAGAVGNMIDSAFYGLIFSESYFHVATLFPEGGGYAPLMFGRVVDMLYFPLIVTEKFIFFRPVFNIADSAVTVGFALFLITQRAFWWPGKKQAAEL